jgi:hypothetical protein
MFLFLTKWLAVLATFYLVGGLASCSTYLIFDKLTEPRNLMAKIRPGLTLVDAEAIVGRPPEYKLNYACVPECGPFSHNWTIDSHRVEVIFNRSGHVQEVLTYQREPNHIERVIGWAFFWWVPDD